MDNFRPQKGMPDDDYILSSLESNLNETLTISQDWRQFEVRENFAIFEGNQWDKAAAERQTKNDMSTIVINRVAPVLEAISGFEIQNRLDIKYTPRVRNAEQIGYSDIMNNVVRYIEQNSNAYNQYSLAFKDMLICGVGATDTVVNYDNNPDGETIIKRIFPAFVFWDSAARAKNITDSDLVILLKILNTDIIQEEYRVDYYDNVYSVSLDARILEFFNAVLAVKTLGVVYEYQWRQKFYRVKNPFLNLDFQQYPPIVAQILEALKTEYAQKYKFSPDMDALFSVEKENDLADIKRIFEPLGIEIKSTTQNKFKYYRAIITGGKVIEKSENYSQNGFSIKFMTGQFSELTQSYYGLGRGCKDPQRLLNQTVADFEGYLQTIPKGGVEMEEDAVDDIAAFVDTYTKAKHVTLYSPGGLAKSRPKMAPPMPTGILEMIQYADSQIMQVCGVTQELMGMMNSKEMNASFLRQLIKQGLTTLSTYFDAKHVYMQEQAKLYCDCVRILAENSEGRLIKNVLDKGEEQYLPLTKDRIAAEYDIVVEDMPITPDEDNDTFMKLLELQSMMMNKPNPVDIMPLVIQFAPVPTDIREQMLEMMKPPPPPQPDPLNNAILESEVNYKNASAEKIKAEAQNLMIESQIKLQEVEIKPIREGANVGLTEAKTMTELLKSQHSSKPYVNGMNANINH